MNVKVAVTYTTNGKRFRLPFERLKNAVLGSAYTLSVVFAGETRMRNLNKKYRKKEYVPNVLSFPLSRKQGEIFISPKRVQVEAKRYSLSESGYAAYLLIHGLLHLKGMGHGATMEKSESKLLQKFHIK